MTLPATFVEHLTQLAREFSKPKGYVRRSHCESYIGKMARLAYVVPAVRPYLGALYAALFQGKSAEIARRREAPPGHLARKRFSAASSWLATLLEQTAQSPFALERIVHYPPWRPRRDRTYKVLFDASPEGGGGVMVKGKRPVAYWRQRWTADSAAHLRVEVGISKHQTFWEFASALKSLEIWADDHTLYEIGRAHV